MKDAFGGTFMIKVMMVFFVIYICFFTVAISFAKTFRIKNEVINILETKSNVNNEKAVIREIDDYLKSISYVYDAAHYPNVKSACDGTLTDNGVCLKQITDEADKHYYVVTAYIVMNFPLFNFGYALPISGETKIIDY